MNAALLFNIQKFCLHDGPGIRTNVFFKGCPLTCKWCSNPESQSFIPELLYHKRLCIGCGTCVAVCKKQALRLTSEGVSIDRGQCDLCGNCKDSCPTGALSIAGEWISIEAIIDRVNQDRAFYETSGGGVTLSGGEPLAQPDAATALLEACRRQGLHTAVETCGNVKTETFRAVRELVDIFLYDVKAIDSKHHKAGTGVENQLIQSNLKELLQTGAKVILRVPLIPGFNLTDAFSHDLIKLIRKIKIARVDLIPYHRLGLSKYEALSRFSQFDAVKPLEESIFSEFQKQLRCKTMADVRKEY